MDDLYLIAIFAIVGVLSLGLTALILVRSDPKPTRSMWIVAVATVLVGLIVAFVGVVIAINLIFG
jgi:hypothetical protein